MGYCDNMINNVKIYVSDKYWNQILGDLGCCIVETPGAADVVFDDLDIKTPITVVDLENTIFNYMNNTDTIRRIFGENVILPTLQHKIVVLLYKNPNMTMADIKSALGISPDVTSHVVENAIYQLRKKYGHKFIENTNGKYKIGRI